MLPQSSTIDRRLWLSAALIPMLFLAIYGLSGFRGLYGQDSYAYLLYSKAISAFLHGEAFAGHWHWPALYPMSGALLSFSGLSIQVSLMAVNLLAYAVLFFSCAAILNRQYPGQMRSIVVYLILFLCCSPFLLRNALSIMSECSAMACFYLCVHFACFSTQPARVLLACLFAALAICTRYAMLVLVFVPLLYALLRDFRKGSYVNWIGGLVLAGIILYLQSFGLGTGMEGFFSNAWLDDWSLMNVVKHDFVNEDGRQRFGFPNLLYAASLLVHPGFLCCGAVLLFFIRRKDVESPQGIFVITVLIYLLFIAGFPTQNSRLLLPAFPLVLLLYYPAYLRLKTLPLIGRFPRLAVLLALLLQMLLFIRAFAPMVYRERMEKNIALALQSLPPGHTVYSSGLDGALEIYGVKNPVKNIYLEDYARFERNAYLLIHPAELQGQWMGTRPYQNWKKMQAQHQLVTRLELEGGWVLYELR